MSYDEYEHAFDRVPRARPPRPSGPGDRVAGILLLGVEGTVACGAYITVILGAEISNRCVGTGRACDHALLDRLLLLGRAAVPVVVALSVLAVVVRIARGRRVWWVPIAGCASLVAVVYAYIGSMELAVS
jgi:hypothetical protein